MTDALSALHSLRKMQQEKKRRAFSAARSVRDAQQARVDSLVDELDALRSGGEGESAVWFAQRQNDCLQMEMRRRREQRQLDVHNAETERLRLELQTARRNEQIVGLFLDDLNQTLAMERRRDEERTNNEIASQGWWRQCS